MRKHRKLSMIQSSHYTQHYIDKFNLFIRRRLPSLFHSLSSAYPELGKRLTVRHKDRYFSPLTIKAVFSAGVWKRPWPNLEEVSTNFSFTSSRYLRLKLTSRDCSNSTEQSHTARTSVAFAEVTVPFSE